MDWSKAPPFGIGTPEELAKQFEAHCKRQLDLLFLAPKFSKQRFLDIFNAWSQDLDRSKSANFRNTEICPDHIKAAAHLTYWIRREAPLIDLTAASGQYDDFEMWIVESFEHDVLNPAYEELTAAELESHKVNDMTFAAFLKYREKVHAYGNELFAFTFGYHLARAYEIQKQLEAGRQVEIPKPSHAFVEDLCYFFKFKSVSPHSIDLIYRAFIKPNV